jgi:PAS domain S-box-containing protein
VRIRRLVCLRSPRAVPAFPSPPNLRLTALMYRDAQIIECLPDAVFVLTCEWAICDVNARSAQLCGYRRDELPGAPFETLFPARLSEREMMRCDEHVRVLERASAFGTRARRAPQGRWRVCDSVYQSRHAGVPYCGKQ